MKVELDSGVVTLFGSETRAATLSVLANARRPLTAYRVATIAGTQVIKAITELRRLEEAGFVARTETSGRPIGWVVADRDLQSLLRKRVPIRWNAKWSRWLSEREKTGCRAATLYDRLAKLPHPQPPKGWEPRDPKRFDRSPVKDDILRSMGKATSLHAR